MKKQLLIIALLSAGVSTMNAINLTTNSSDDSTLANLTVADVADYAKAADRKYSALYAHAKGVAHRHLRSNSAHKKSVAQEVLKAFHDFLETKEGQNLVKTQLKSSSDMLAVGSSRLMGEDPQSTTEAIATR